ncbi:MAG: hypothetical protein H0T87_14540 [Gammaproteobacteria bacterium]|nr:hypothetical protein [Gammaproteobacteria bacterium]
MNRMERGSGGTLSAIEEIKKLYHLPITSIVILDAIIERLEGSPAYQEPLVQMRAYQSNRF